jgi:hypothetical protein
MAEHRVGSAGEQSSGLVGERCASPVTDEVDAAMDPVQPAGRDPVIDRAVAKARGTELPPRHRAVLSRRDRARRVTHPAVKLSFSLATGGKLNLARWIPTSAHTNVRRAGAGIRPRR